MVKMTQFSGGKLAVCHFCRSEQEFLYKNPKNVKIVP